MNIGIWGNCRKKDGRRIRIAKVAKRYFGVESKEVLAVEGWLRQFIMENVISLYYLVY